MGVVVVLAGYRALAIVSCRCIQIVARHTVRTVFVRANDLQAKRAFDVRLLTIFYRDGEDASSFIAISVNCCVFNGVWRVIYLKVRAWCQTAALNNGFAAVVFGHRIQPEHGSAALARVIVQGHVARAVLEHRWDVVNDCIGHRTSSGVATFVGNSPNDRCLANRQHCAVERVILRCHGKIVRPRRAIAIIREIRVHLLVSDNFVPANGWSHIKCRCQVVAIDTRVFIVFQSHFRFAGSGIARIVSHNELNHTHCSMQETKSGTGCGELLDVVHATVVSSHQVAAHIGHRARAVACAVAGSIGINW